MHRINGILFQLSLFQKIVAFHLLFFHSTSSLKLLKGMRSKFRDFSAFGHNDDPSRTNNFCLLKVLSLRKWYSWPIALTSCVLRETNCSERDITSFYSFELMTLQQTQNSGFNINVLIIIGVIFSCHFPKTVLLT